MDKLISNSPNSFVGGRQILDSVLIAKKCLDSKIKSSIQSVIVKSDIEKTYDHVNWNALFNLMERMGYKEKRGRWMKACISTICFQFLLMGLQLGFLVALALFVKGADYLHSFSYW